MFIVTDCFFLSGNSKAVVEIEVDPSSEIDLATIEKTDLVDAIKATSGLETVQSVEVKGLQLLCKISPDYWNIFCDINITDIETKQILCMKRNVHIL